MKPSDFAWWMWIIFAFIAGFIAYISWSITEQREEIGERAGFWPVLFGISGSISAFFCFVMGIIRFIKWAWNG